jgi:hypothetical protein
MDLFSEGVILGGGIVFGIVCASLFVWLVWTEVRSKSRS